MEWHLFMMKRMNLKKKVNPETVVWQRLETEYWRNLLKNLVQKHFEETKSKIAERIIFDYKNEINHFYQVCPKEMLDKIDNPITIKDKINIAI